MSDCYRGMREEVLALREALDDMGVTHEDSDEITYFLNGDGECSVFPSVQHEGRLFVTYTKSTYVATAADALDVCDMRASS